MGGMAGDIYGSMAEGVSNASCVVCFMSQKYQESENCRLELQFAKQSGVSLLPVMVEGSGWRASGWLGLLTAGALWTRLQDDSSFEENVRQLQSQIHQMIGDQLQDDDDPRSGAGKVGITYLSMLYTLDVNRAVLGMLQQLDPRIGS